MRAKSNHSFDVHLFFFTGASAVCDVEELTATQTNRDTEREREGDCNMLAYT